MSLFFKQQEAQLLQRERATRCELTSCQLLYNCTKNPIRKSLQNVNDLKGH